MTRVLRGALVALAAVPAACRPVAPLSGIGRSTAGPPPARADGGGPPPASPVPADFAARFVPVGPDSFVAWGHAAGRWAARVYVSPEAKGFPLGGPRDLPVGTQVVMVSVDHASHAPGPTFFMQKGATSWTYGLVEAPETKPEALWLCARCHAEAQHDDVFALPEP